MWNCTNCQAAVDDGIDVCGSCGGARAAGEGVSLTQAAEVGGVATEAAQAVATVAPAAEASVTPTAPAEPTAWEVVRALEAELSALMDARATADWKVNPAFHADVNAFIQKHSNNSGFVQKARGLQQNRAKFYAKMREIESAGPRPVAAEAPPMATEIPMTADAPMATEFVGETAAAETVPADSPAVPTGTPAVAPAPGGSRILRRLVKLTFLLLILLIGLGLMGAVGYRQYGKKLLEDAISETDRLSPDWQWKSLQVNRAEVPDDQNAALVVLKTAKMVGGSYSVEDDTIDWATERAKYQPALKMARVLEKLARGRYPGDEILAIAEPGSEFELKYESQLKDVCGLLHDEAQFLARENQPDEALAVWRCLFNASRSMGDDPNGQFLRLSQVTAACELLQRMLAMTRSPDPETLAGIQALLASELNQPVLATRLRGARAVLFEYMSTPFGHELMLVGPFPWYKDVPDSSRPLLGFLLTGEALRQRAEMLRWSNLLVQLADLQPHELASNADPLSEVMAYPQVSISIIEDYLKYQAVLRCTLTGLAAERYRLARQEWPTELSQLVPEILDKVPLDPYDGKPLRLKRDEGELVIYSVGPDQQDQQGEDDDISCRLMDVAQRRP